MRLVYISLWFDTKSETSTFGHLEKDGLIAALSNPLGDRGHVDTRCKESVQMMVLKISLIFTVVVLRFVSAGSEDLDFKPNCHFETISCSCMKSVRRNGFQLNVTVKSCASDLNEDKKSICYERCKKGKSLAY